MTKRPVKMTYTQRRKAKLVAVEREACAQVAALTAVMYGLLRDESSEAGELSQALRCAASKKCAEDIAAAIRARALASGRGTG